MLRGRSKKEQRQKEEALIGKYQHYEPQTKLKRV